MRWICVKNQQSPSPAGSQNPEALQWGTRSGGDTLAIQTIHHLDPPRSTFPLERYERPSRRTAQRSENTE